MAKKPKKVKPDKKVPTDRVKPSEVSRQIGARKLRELIATACAASNDMREIAGSLGAEIKDAAENHHLHKKAFAADRMEPEKLAEFLDCLDYYLDVTGLRDRASKVQRLPMGDEDENPEQADNVKPFPAPSSVAAE